MIRTYHECDREDSADIYYGEVPMVGETTAWWLDLGMEWCEIRFCPFCGTRLADTELGELTGE